MRTKSIMLFAAAIALHLQYAHAGVQPTTEDTVRIGDVYYADAMFHPLEPTCESGVLTASPWNGNWFVNVSGGASAFLGTPLGCDDLFGRMKPTVNISLGKWFTPSVGGRLNYQGWQFEDCQKTVNDYQYLHADFLWNILGSHYNSQEYVRWAVIPFAGVGMMHNKENGHKPFAISYGIQAQYRFSKRIALTMELSNATTFEDFDGYGTTNKFDGDNLLSLSAGLSITLGKAGWKRVVNATPYIRQNEWLIDYANALHESNGRYASLHDKDSRTIAELRKILEIEGLLDIYGNLFDEDNKVLQRTYPKNDYSGLNSLRSRMKNRYVNGRVSVIRQTAVGMGDSTEVADSLDSNDYLLFLQNGQECIGSPIYFFFDLGTTKLTDSSQLVNLDALAKVAKKYGLAIKVVGAADSATGNTAINNTLSTSRAEYIYSELLKRDIAQDMIAKRSEGGIEDYTPEEANRHTRVLLYFK